MNNLNTNIHFANVKPMNTKRVMRELAWQHVNDAKRIVH
jgi:hypothetical protein